MTRKTEDWHFGTNESKYAEANMLIGNGDVWEVPFIKIKR